MGSLSDGTMIGAAAAAVALSNEGGGLDREEEAYTRVFEDRPPRRRHPAGQPQHSPTTPPLPPRHQVVREEAEEEDVKIISEIRWAPTTLERALSDNPPMEKPAPRGSEVPPPVNGWLQFAKEGKMGHFHRGIWHAGFPICENPKCSAGHRIDSTCHLPPKDS